MRVFAVLALLIVALLAVPGGSFASPTRPQSLSAAERDSLTAAILKDRAESEEFTKSGATSYLATVSRVDFGSSAKLVVGSAPGADVRIDDPDMPARALEVAVEGDSFHVRTLDDTLTFHWRNLAFHTATLPPAGIQLGRWTVRLSHQRYPALIVFDPKSPRFASYHGLEFFPVDLRLRFLAPLIPSPAPDTVIILSTRGNQRRALRVGWFNLLVNGKPVRLEAHRLLEPGIDEQSVSVFFRDATTGKETYAVGRYVDPERQDDGRWLLDFNAAYNPACAMSPHYNCPIPSKANQLSIAIKAGEKDAHYAH